ncbi:hypothetical protein [Gulosibacter molinativorax]|uniref:DUF4258 domain-containing protein n=1 Tax=Gulosibacter molinativorax TaxID=256821 RepID=A0ABT7C720_9MICO|nr:hypothetical protein [Gulosibacter molinativorax]MDJ1370903.1 hypothetical protein [Gulosibacter molinativorax]QUY62240.1 Hypotetical protein [Gulosibacter molinativorax]
MQIRFSRSSRKHKVGRASAITAMTNAGVPREIDGQKLLWIGVDDRDRELEIIGFVAAEDPNLVIIIHVMPMIYRKEGHWE